MDRTPKFSIGKLIFSIVFNAAVLALVLLVFVPFFEEIDDTNVALIVEGAFGLREWHVIYPNIILGKLYVLLQTIFPLVRWHAVLQYVFIYIAYVLAVYVISKHKRGLFISIAAVLSTCYEMYVSIQYTKTASFVCVVGFILVFEYVRNKSAYSNVSDRLLSNSDKTNSKENKLFIIMAVILIVYGALLRPESFFIAAVPTAAAGLLELLRTKNIKKYLITFAPVFVVVILLSVFNSYIYSINSEWSDFMKYNQARMQLNDYRYDILDFNRYEDKLKELNVSENDALAILTYQFGDDTILSYERFKEIRDAFDAREFGYTTFANLYENLVNELFRSYALFAGLAGVILVLVASIVTDRSKSSPGFIKDSRRKFFCMILMGACLASAVVYFQYSGRYSHRLIGALLVPTIFIVCYIMDSIYIKDNDSKIVFGGNKNDISMPAGIALCVIALALNGLLYISNIADYNIWISESRPMLREIEEMNRDKNSLYIGDTFTFQNMMKYEVFGANEPGSLDNFITCGSWYINSPVTKSISRRYGFENPFDALRSGNDNVYLLDNQGVGCKTLFLTEHYDKVYKAEKLENRGGIDVYKVISDNEE